MATGRGQAGGASYDIPLDKTSNGAARRSPLPAAQRAAARHAKRGACAKDFGIDTFCSGGTADAPARSSTIILSVAALPAPRPAAHSSTHVQLLTGLSGVLAPIHIIDLYGPVCVGTTHSNASDSLLKSTGRPSERLDRRRGQRAISRFRVPAEVYAAASYLN